MTIGSHCRTAPGEVETQLIGLINFDFRSHQKTRDDAMSNTHALNGIRDIIFVITTAIIKFYISNLRIIVEAAKYCPVGWNG
jgi:hypothetical protein